MWERDAGLSITPRHHDVHSSARESSDMASSCSRGKTCAYAACQVLVRTRRIASASAGVASRTTTRLLDVRDRLDLDAGAGRELCDADGRAGRRAVAHVACVDAVHAGEVREIDEEHRRLDEPVEAAPGRLEDRGHVPHDPVGLLLDRRARELARREIDADLPGAEDKVADPYRLVVGRSLERRRGAVGADHLFLCHVAPFCASFYDWAHARASAPPSALKMGE